ncbi:MAG: 3-hydroxyacyl-CoA dehydrogenase family protein [Myxococcota bacterium]
MMIDEVLVVGAGTMGAGIAEVAAKTGARVQLTDVSAEQLDVARALIERSLAKAVEKGKLEAAAAEAVQTQISFTSDPEVERAKLIVEAVPESMTLKKKLSAELGVRAPDAIYGTNTSSLSVTEIAAATPNPGRVLGMHFFNPPPVMKLLEVIRAEQTSEASLATATAWAESAGKHPIVIKDVPGFATSRLGIILGMEAIRMLEMGVGSAADIDAAMELGYRHPMGPLRLTDLVGLDVRLAIAEHLTKELGPQFTPPPLLRQKVRAGKLGKKTGEGFYLWND